MRQYVLYKNTKCVMKKIVTCLVAIFFLSSCSRIEQCTTDPYEKANKGAMEFNLALDSNMLQPTAHAYKKITSPDVRISIGNFLNNLQEPYYCVNYLILFHGERATASIFRFAINSTIGIFGLMDVAYNMGLKRDPIGYQDTLYQMGISPGNYIVLPFVGSTSSNYLVGGCISLLCNPMSYVLGFPSTIAKVFADAVSDRAANSDTIDSMLSSEMDPYSVANSIYIQKYAGKSTNSKIHDADLSDTPMPDDYDEQLENALSVKKR